MHLTHLDHLVLMVQDLEITCIFYAQALGMQIIRFGQGQIALGWGHPPMMQKINLHKAGQEFDPKALQPTLGSADLCFITDLPLSAVIAHLKTCDVAIIARPTPRTGANGSLLSVYIRDPDGNLIEIANRVTQ